MIFILFFLIAIIVTSSVLLPEGPGSVFSKFVGALSQDNDLVLCLGVFPAAEDEEMRADCGAGVTKTAGGWVADVLTTLPGHGVSRPDHEVVTALLGRLVLLASSGGFAPASEEDNV